MPLQLSGLAGVRIMHLVSTEVPLPQRQQGTASCCQSAQQGSWPWPDTSGDISSFMLLLACKLQDVTFIVSLSFALAVTDEPDYW